MSIKARLKRIEVRLGDKIIDEPVDIFITYLEANNGNPVKDKTLGFSYTYLGNQLKVIRLDDETEDDLMKRTADIARQSIGENLPVVFSAITEDDLQPILES